MLINLRSEQGSTKGGLVTTNPVMTKYQDDSKRKEEEEWQKKACTDACAVNRVARESGAPLGRGGGQGRGRVRGRRRGRGAVIAGEGVSGGHGTVSATHDSDAEVAAAAVLPGITETVPCPPLTRPVSTTDPSPGMTAPRPVPRSPPRP